MSAPGPAYFAGDSSLPQWRPFLPAGLT